MQTSQTKTDFSLKPWRQIVIDYLEDYEELSNSESFQSLSDYERNRLLSVQISLPVNSGHTALAAYISSVYPSITIFSDLTHYKELELEAAYFDGFNEDSHAISVFEIYHDLVSGSRSPHHAVALDRLRTKFGSSGDWRITVIDQATSLVSAHPEILDWIYQISNGPIVLLG